jgi:hypothetical protein
MRFNDFIHPERGPAALLRFAVYPLVVVVAFAALAMVVSCLRDANTLFAFFALVLASPLAYFIREARQRRPERHMSRRGAERTPLLPPNEEHL